MADGDPPFEALDFVYTPSRDVAADVRDATERLGAELVFAIEAFGARVAMVRPAAEGPHVLFADHLDGERPVLVYRVVDLDDAVKRLEEQGAGPGPQFGIPHGPACEVTLPGGHRIALYELTRPGANERLAGRRDF